MSRSPSHDTRTTDGGATHGAAVPTGPGAAPAGPAAEPRPAFDRWLFAAPAAGAAGSPAGQGAASREAEPATLLFLADAFSCLPELWKNLIGAGGVACGEAPSPGGPPGGEGERGEMLAAALRQAAYRLAVALGQCRLLGVGPEASADFALPPPIALEAGRALCESAAGWVAQTWSLPPAWPAAWAATPADPRAQGCPPTRSLAPGEIEPSDDECRHVCVALIEVRMEACAAYHAIDESYAATLDSGDSGGVAAGDFSVLIDHALDALEAFDDALRGRGGTLAAAAGADLLRQWANLLAPEFRDLPPCWLAADDAPLLPRA